MLISGILILARSTGRVLLVKRSSKVRNPNVWSIPGGLVEYGESIVEGALRETLEEVGFDGPYLDLLYLFTHKKGEAEFTTYLGIVEDEFDPLLNWESSDAGWFDPSFATLPHPLHPGLRSLWIHRSDVIEDIATAVRRGRRTA